MIFIIVAVMWIISICICIVLGGANIGKCDMFENTEITCKKSIKILKTKLIKK